MIPTYHRFTPLKILAHSDRLRQVAAGGYPYPLDWHVFPSNICNHACNWCMYRQNGEQKNFPVQLPRSLLLRAPNEAARTGAVLMHFSGGGEPLLNKHTPEAMEGAGRRGLRVALSTNGRLLTPDVAQLVDYIRVSLNAGTAEQHTKTNHGGEGPGDWRTIVENLRRCIPRKRQDLGLAFAADDQNWRDVEPFVALAADVGADFVHIRPAFYYEPEKDAAVRNMMPHLWAACERAKAAHGHKVQVFAISAQFDGYWTPRSYHACKAVLTGTTLRATGDFAVCQDRTDLVFGRDPSYRAGASFEDVWHSEEHRRVVQSIHDGDGGELSKCPRCVWNARNVILDEVFGQQDSMRLDLI